MFELHGDLQRDCFAVGEFPLCLLLAMNDANYPWFVLVPKRAGLRELYDLTGTDRAQFMRESTGLAQRLATEFRADKMNVAALGNVTPQLHIHHVVRYKGDPAWPAPIWGKVPARPYGSADRAALLERVRRCLSAGALEFIA
jgi:diadenosine tetraphosphate (Ap4A) HIT family hydrolase